MFHDLRTRVHEELLLGAVSSIPSAAVVEALGRVPFPVILIDAEHTPLSIDRLESLLRAADLAPTAAVVRVPESGSYIGRVLDLGAAGIMVPQVETADQVRDVVRRSRYAPEGSRGAGLGRSAGYGPGLAAQVAEANSQILVSVQIESVTGLEAVDEILAVPGVDAVVIGPFDLAVSMGVPMGSAEHSKAIDTVFAAADRHGVAKGTFLMSPDQLPEYVDRGATLILAGVDLAWLMSGAQAAWDQAAALTAIGSAQADADIEGAA